MPIARNYNGGSIIYFQGDVSDNVYVLQQGRVILISTALDSSEEVKEEVQLGEFFGVKSVLGKYHREETAQCIGRTTCIVFKPDEFEQYVLKNTRIVVKMLRVFSKQLRNIHRQVRQILKAGAVKDPAYELMNVAESFYKSGNIDHAVYAFQKYSEYYPNGSYVSRAGDLLQMARKGLTFPMGYPELEATNGDMGMDPNIVARGMMKVEQADSMDDPFALDSGASKRGGGLIEIFTSGVNAAKVGNSEIALAKFNQVMEYTQFKNQEEQDAFAKAHFEKGKVELKIGQHEEASNTFSLYVKKFPSGENIKDCILSLGMVAEATGNKERAGTLYRKAATMPPPDNISREAKLKLEKLGL